MESKYFFAIKYLLINENLWCWKTLNVYKSTSSTHERCNSLSLEGYHVVLRAIWKIDVHLIGTLVNKSLYYYYIIIVPMILRPHVYSSHSMCSNKKLEVSTCDQLSQNIRSSSSQKLRLLLTLQTEV